MSPSVGVFGSMRPDGGTTTLDDATLVLLPPTQPPKKLALLRELDVVATDIGLSGDDRSELVELSEFDRGAAADIGAANAADTGLLFTRGWGWI